MKSFVFFFFNKENGGISTEGQKVQKKRNLFLNIKGEHLSSCGRVSCDKNLVDAPSHRCVLVCCEVRRGPPAPFASLSRKL